MLNRQSRNKSMLLFPLVRINFVSWVDVFVFTQASAASDAKDYKKWTDGIQNRSIFPSPECESLPFLYESVIEPGFDPQDKTNSSRCQDDIILVQVLVISIQFFSLFDIRPKACFLSSLQCSRSCVRLYYTVLSYRLSFSSVGRCFDLLFFAVR
jgi:hypothetical protein